MIDYYSLKNRYRTTLLWVPFDLIDKQKNFVEVFGWHFTKRDYSIVDLPTCD